MTTDQRRHFPELWAITNVFRLYSLNPLGGFKPGNSKHFNIQLCNRLENAHWSGGDRFCRKSPVKFKASLDGNQNIRRGREILLGYTCFTCRPKVVEGLCLWTLPESRKRSFFGSWEVTRIPGFSLVGAMQYGRYRNVLTNAWIRRGTGTCRCNVDASKSGGEVTGRGIRYHQKRKANLCWRLWTPDCHETVEKVLRITTHYCIWILDVHTAPPMLRGQYNNSNHLAFWASNNKNVTNLWRSKCFLTGFNGKQMRSTFWTLRHGHHTGLSPWCNSAKMSEMLSQSRRYSSKSNIGKLNVSPQCRDLHLKSNMRTYSGRTEVKTPVHSHHPDQVNIYVFWNMAFRHYV